MGARKLLEEKIAELINTLPDDELEGLLVYMENLRAKKKEQTLKFIHELAGKYKGKLSSTEEFSRRKQEEKKLDH